MVEGYHLRLQPMVNGHDTENLNRIRLKNRKQLFPALVSCNGAKRTCPSFMSRSSAPINKRSKVKLLPKVKMFLDQLQGKLHRVDLRCFDLTRLIRSTLIVCRCQTQK